ncbi:hypothetical protein ABT354_26915 [Streptomyces sp. NPDC000594]|uniref:hypothetical protein n=1 Tax=Streptomyces sp. NPDC000594 TaxID=3154261 RepID=UPI003323883E
MNIRTASRHTASRHTASRRTARLRLAAVVAAPLLAFSVACSDGEGARSEKGGEVASVPDDPTGDGSAKDTKDAKATAAGKDTSKPAAGRSAFYDAQLEYVRCMRTKAGVKDFPDPRLSGYLDFGKIEKVIDPRGNGEEYKGGKNGVCFPEMSKAMELEPERDKQKDYESLLAHATCMRDNGVSRFTNPTMSGGGVMPGGDPSPANPVLDRDSPTYREARQACEGKLLEGLDGMQ